MKKLKKEISKNAVRIGLVLLMVVVVCISFVKSIKEEAYYKSYDRSKVIIEGSSNVGNWLIEATDFACDGNFAIENAVLQEISALSFALPVTQLKSDNPLMNAALEELFKHNGITEISFKQTSAMVLPVMKMTNLIGELQIGTKSNMIELHLNQVLNKDGSLTFYGTKNLKLSDYQLKMPDMIMGAIKNSDDIKVNIEVTLDNKQAAQLKAKDLSE